jgi:DNA (cytosine-5)-methyltransferase 1
VDGLLAAERRSRRMADGLPDRLEPARVRALGNAVVPQAAKHIGRLIHHHMTTQGGLA